MSPLHHFDYGTEENAPCGVLVGPRANMIELHTTPGEIDKILLVGMRCDDLPEPGQRPHGEVISIMPLTVEAASVLRDQLDRLIKEKTQ